MNRKPTFASEIGYYTLNLIAVYIYMYILQLKKDNETLYVGGK